jgi:hypothetical protein
MSCYPPHAYPPPISFISHFLCERVCKMFSTLWFFFLFPLTVAVCICRWRLMPTRQARCTPTRACTLLTACLTWSAGSTRPSSVPTRFGPTFQDLQALLPSSAKRPSQRLVLEHHFEVVFAIADLWWNTIPEVYCPEHICSGTPCPIYMVHVQRYPRPSRS